MGTVVDIVMCVLLVASCLTSLFAIVIFWYMILSGLLDGIIGVSLTDKEIDDKTK